MGQSTEELTSQIEDTRDRMSSDLDSLQDRVSPSAIVQRRKDAARERVSSVRDRVMGSAQSLKDSTGDATGNATSAAQDRFDGNPLAAGLVAFGAGLIVASLLPASSIEAEAAHRVVETAKDQAQPLVEDAKAAGQTIVSNVKESASDAAAQIKDSAQQSVATVKDEGASSAQTVRDQAQS